MLNFLYGDVLILKKHFSLRLLAVILSLALIAVTLPVISLSATAEASEISIATLSDIHYTDASNAGGYNEAILLEEAADVLQYSVQDGLLDSAFAAIAADAEEKNIKYLLVSGDLSANGEYSNHVGLAERFAEFEAETGIQVIVTNGNHDINYKDSNTYANGFEEDTDNTSPEEFMEIYADFGWDLAYHTYTPSEGKAGMLSYSVQLEGGFRLIVIDAGKYSSDNTDAGEDVGETGGNITDELMEWILEEIADATANGETVIGMSHWSIVYSDFFTSYTLQGFVMDNFEYVADTLADAGMHYFFTGHTHVSDICVSYSDAGEAMYDIVTNSLSAYPNMFRETTISRASDGTLTATFDCVDVDEVLLVTDAFGTTYEYPYRETGSLQNQMNDFDVADWLSDILLYMLTNSVVPGIEEYGSLIGFIEASMDIDLADTLTELLGGGISLGPITIDGENIVSLLSDLDEQLCDRYLNADALEYDKEVMYEILTDIMNTEISDVSCTKFLDTYGFGSTSSGGTLGDFVIEVFIYRYYGNEDASDDAFVLDVAETVADGTFIDLLIDIVVEYIVDDLLVDEILANTYLNLGTFFTNDFFTILIDDIILDYIAKIVSMFGGETDMASLVDFIFSLGVLDDYGTDLDSLIYNLIDTYIGELPLLQVSQWLVTELESFTVDENPTAQGDSGVTYVYSGPVEVEATTSNYRLPTMVTVTMGEDSESEAYISWYTRWSVTGTDIEIYKDDGTLVAFIGEDNSSDYTITKTTEATVREFPGVDLDIFGLFYDEITLTRHIITLSDLEAGTTYYYRIGDAEKGWWSETGSITTADGSDSVTFLHVADSQSASLLYYEQWAETLAAASEVTDYDFILHTGDFVDNGRSVTQYQYCLDIASEYLMNTFFMPVSGNHDAYGDYSLQLTFTLPGLEEFGISLDTGVTYSFDYNNVHIAVINTNDLDDDDVLNEEQIEWLKNDIASTDADWVFVAFHKAIYSDGSHSSDDDVVNIRSQLTDLMTELDIDLVFNGHDHVYMRTGVINNGDTLDTETATITHNGITYELYNDPDGTFYVLSGTAGSKFYTSGLEDTSAYFDELVVSLDLTDSVFSVVEIDSDTLYLTAYAVGDSDTYIIDSFAIQKTLEEKSYDSGESESSADTEEDTLASAEEESDTSDTDATASLLGDVDLDGDIDLADARLALQGALELAVLDDEQSLNADVDLDGSVTTADARLILLYAADLLSEF